MVLFCFDSYFHLTSILLSYEIVDFCSEKSSNQIGIENQGVKSVNILNILFFYVLRYIMDVFSSYQA